MTIGEALTMAGCFGSRKPGTWLENKDNAELITKKSSAPSQPFTFQIFNSLPISHGIYF